MASDQKDIVIIGASRGIGLGFAEYYLQQGHNVAATCRTDTPDRALAQLKEKYPDTLKVYPNIDITSAKSIETLSEQIKHVDLLILNAGIKGYVGAPGTQPQSNTGEELQRAFEVNTKGHNHVMLTFYKKLLHANAAAVYISSGVSSISDNARGCAHPYRITKAAGNQMIRNWALRVLKEWEGPLEELPCAFAIAAGWVKTDMGGPDAQLTIQDSVSQMAKVIAETIESKKMHGLLMYHGRFLDVYKTPRKLALWREEKLSYEALVEENARLESLVANLKMSAESQGQTPELEEMVLSTTPIFTPNVIVIIGVSRDVGLAFTEYYLQQGHTVIVTCEEYSPDCALAQLKEKYPANLTVYPNIDITNVNDIQNFSSQVKHVDLLILNEEVALGTKTQAYSSEELERAFKVNVIAPNNIMLAFFTKLQHPNAAAVYISSDLSSISNNVAGNDHSYRISMTGGNQMIRNWDLALLKAWEGSFEELPCAFAVCPSAKISRENVAQMANLIAEKRVSKKVQGLLTHEGNFLEIYKAPEKLWPKLGETPSYESLLQEHERLKHQVESLSSSASMASDSNIQSSGYVQSLLSTSLPAFFSLDTQSNPIVAVTNAEGKEPELPSRPPIP